MDEADALEELHACGLVKCYGDLETLRSISISQISSALSLSGHCPEATVQARARELSDMVIAMTDLLDRFVLQTSSVGGGT